MIAYRLDDLGWFEFEQLVQTLANISVWTEEQANSLTRCANHFRDEAESLLEGVTIRIFPSKATALFVQPTSPKDCLWKINRRKTDTNTEYAAPYGARDSFLSVLYKDASPTGLNLFEITGRLVRWKRILVCP
jgi:hypothetical protein